MRDIRERYGNKNVYEIKTYCEKYGLQTHYMEEVKHITAESKLLHLLKQKTKDDFILIVSSKKIPLRTLYNI